MTLSTITWFGGTTLMLSVIFLSLGKEDKNSVFLNIYFFQIFRWDLLWTGYNCLLLRSAKENR